MRPLVVGLGNDQRGDDGAGLEAARRLAPLLAGTADVRGHPGEPVDLIDLWTGRNLVVLVDASPPAGRPGAIHRFERGHDPLPARGLGVSLHAFDLAVVLDLADALGHVPDRLVVLAVEGERFGLGDVRSAAVDRALDDVIARVRAEIRRPRTPSVGGAVPGGSHP